MFDWPEIQNGPDPKRGNMVGAAWVGVVGLWPVVTTGNCADTRTTPKHARKHIIRHRSGPVPAPKRVIWSTTYQFGLEKKFNGR
jgi:hypothetical protein